MRQSWERSFLLASIDMNLFEREGKKTFLLQTAEEFSASHILEGTVGLMPVPDLT